MLFRKFFGMEAFQIKEGGNKKPHSLGSGVTHHLSSPEEIMKYAQSGFLTSGSS